MLLAKHFATARDINIWGTIYTSTHLDTLRFLSYIYDEYLLWMDYRSFKLETTVTQRVVLCISIYNGKPKYSVSATAPWQYYHLSPHTLCGYQSDVYTADWDSYPEYTSYVVEGGVRATTHTIYITMYPFTLDVTT